MQINNGKVSVIIPVWNAHDYIRRCVDSIVNQTYENLEILLVDDEVRMILYKYTGSMREKMIE